MAAYPPNAIAVSQRSSTASRHKYGSRAIRPACAPSHSCVFPVANCCRPACISMLPHAQYDPESRTAQCHNRNMNKKQRSTRTTLAAKFAFLWSFPVRSPTKAAWSTHDVDVHAPSHAPLGNIFRLRAVWSWSTRKKKRSPRVNRASAKWRPLVRIYAACPQSQAPGCWHLHQHHMNR